MVQLLNTLNNSLTTASIISQKPSNVQGVPKNAKAKHLTKRRFFGTPGMVQDMLRKVSMKRKTLVGIKNLILFQTRTTIVVRNAGCPRSRYTLNFFKINLSIN